MLIRQLLLLGEDAVQLSTSDEVHQEVNSELSLEDVLHANDEWMLDTKHDMLLQSQVLKLLRVDHNIFPDALHSINLLRLFVADHVHFSKRSLANHFLHFEVIECFLHSSLLLIPCK